MLVLRSLFVVVLLISCSYAQEEAEQLAAANSQIARLTAERDEALKKLASAEAATAQALKDLDTSKHAIADLTRKVQDLSSELKTEVVKASDLQRQLAEAQKTAATSGDELQSLLRQAQDSWLPLWLQYRIMQAQEYIVQLLEDLKGGKHGPVGVHVHSFLDVANTHATNAFVYVKPHVDKGYAAASHHAGQAYAAAKPHLDDGLAKLSVAVDKARVVVEAQWKKYVTDAEWMHEAKAAFAKVEQELIREVSKFMRGVPALQPYSDPVTVQLLVYAIFLVPVVVVLVPTLALLCTRSSASGKDTPRKNKQEKPKPGHGHGKRPHKRA